MQPRVFIIAPLDPEGLSVRQTIRRVVEEAGFRVADVRGKFLNPGLTLTMKILSGIRESDLVIANLSDQNPNVLYEVGVAHALRKPTLLLIDRNADRSLPSDLHGFEYIFYDSKNLGVLADRIKSAVSEFELKRSA